MIIVDPVTLGDVACTRASPKWVFDRTGTLVQVPVDTLAVTYDPLDLNAAPRAMVDLQPVTKCLPSNDDLTKWTIYTTGTATVSVEPISDPLFGTVFRVTKLTGAAGNRAGIKISLFGLSGTKYAAGSFVRRGTATTVGFAPYVDAVVTASSPVSALSLVDATHTVGQWERVEVQAAERTGVTLAGDGTAYVWVESLPGDFLDVKLPEVELGDKLTSPIIIPFGSGLPVTRAADIIAPGAGLVHSNVPITEAPYSAGTTYALGAAVYDPASYLTYESTVAGNVGHALTDTASWLPLGTVVNRRKMLDQYNNTQTTNPDEILMVLSPQAISQGLYLGNLYADEVRISVVDKVEGLVYSETKSLIESNSGSSFYSWFFKRIKRKDYFLTLKLPVYANALVTISLRKIGGIAKCGMCAIGPTDDFGPTLMGLSTEGKDYSSTTFNFDGTSSTVIRPYAKRMSCDVMVDNDQIDYLQARLFEIRQKPIVWVGGPYGSTAVYGRYESFKNVIQYATRSLMNLTIGGAV